MTTTTVIYKPRGIQVKVLDAHTRNGVTYVSIKAIEGQPFADGAKTTTKTAYLTVNRDELEVCTCTPRDEIACPACQRASKKRYGDEIPF